MEIKLLSCPLCLQPHFDGVDSLRTTLVSVATSHLSCPVCNELLLGLDKLTIHLFSHVQDIQIEQQTPSIQEEIDKSIDRLQITKDHETITASQPTTITNETNIRCDICNFSFTDQNILDMHQKLLHQTSPDKKTGLYSYHCHLCSKKFKMRGSLMVHLRVAHYGFQSYTETEVKKNEDEENSKKELNERKNIEIKRISNNKIIDNKQWECDVCTKMFTTKYFLKKHKRLHTGEMPYCCTQCNKSFTFQQSYHKHMLYHSSEKPYVCNECGRAFKELSTLQNHARIHSGERPFACETCGKRFRQRVSYLVHRRIHTGVMPYKCTACEKTFRYRVSQRSHKCPINPPGSVIRVPDETTPTSNNNNVKCIMSVDYNTGNINLIRDTTPKLNIVYVNNENSEESENSFSVVLSPLLPEVASLCLTSSPAGSPDLKKSNNATATLTESLDALLFASNNN